MTAQIISIATRQPLPVPLPIARPAPWLPAVGDKVLFNDEPGTVLLRLSGLFLVEPDRMRPRTFIASLDELAPVPGGQI